jgi:aconitate hydratase
MAKALTHKLIEAACLSGTAEPGADLELRADQVLAHDGSGALLLRQLEALGPERARVETGVLYLDHQSPAMMLGDAGLPRLLRDGAARFGLWFSAPGNGICHQVHAERFGAPGKVLLGVDSHATTGGGLGMLALAVTPLECALAMSGWPHRLRVPHVLGVHLVGALAPWIGAKDVAHALLARLGMRGAWGRAIEFHGPGVASLSASARLTLAHHAAEWGATTCVFPSDEATRVFLRGQGRDADWRAMAADPEATYAEQWELDLSGIEPLLAEPHRPDRVVPLAEHAGIAVRQVCIGSCACSTVADLERAARLLAGRRVHPDVELVVTPGSRQVFATVARSGALAALEAAGARILESACGPCIGAGAPPPAGGASLRSYSRNFPERSGVGEARVYLASPEACAAAAVSGRITDPRELGSGRELPVEPVEYVIDDALLERPAPGERPAGPRPAPRPPALLAGLRGIVLLRVGDAVSSDHIVAGGAQVQADPSDVGGLAERTFATLDPEFAARARAHGGGFVVARHHYGVGSARAQAALAVVELGVRAVMARSFARAHRESLVGFGVLPLLLASDGDYENLEAGDELEIPGLPEALEPDRPLVVRNLTRGSQFAVQHRLDARELEIVRAGGLLGRGLPSAA